MSSYKNSKFRLLDYGSILQPLFIRGEKLITQEELKKLVTYFPETGEFIWKRRYPDDKRTNKTFNTRFEGKSSVHYDRGIEPRIIIKGENKAAKMWARYYVDGVLPKKVAFINGDKKDLRYNNLITKNEDITFVEDSKDYHIDQKTLKALVDYNPETGEFKWKPRFEYTFSDVSWNTIYAGKRAGNLHHSGYRHVKILNKNYTEHRLIFLYMTGTLPAFVDHKDNNPSNNKWDNLRVSTREENNWNAVTRKDNKLGIKGVSQVHDTQRWVGRVYHNKECYSKVFKTIEEATEWVKKTREEYHQEFYNHG